LPYPGGLVTTKDPDAVRRAQWSGYGHLSWPYRRPGRKAAARPRSPAPSRRVRPARTGACAAPAGSGSLRDSHRRRGTGCLGRSGRGAGPGPAGRGPPGSRDG